LVALVVLVDSLLAVAAAVQTLTSLLAELAVLVPVVWFVFILGNQL
jgi:hypothetical protein